MQVRCPNCDMEVPYEKYCCVCGTAFPQLTLPPEVTQLLQIREHLGLREFIKEEDILMRLLYIKVIRSLNPKIADELLDQLQQELHLSRRELENSLRELDEPRAVIRVIESRLSSKLPPDVPWMLD